MPAVHWAKSFCKSGLSLVAEHVSANTSAAEVSGPSGQFRRASGPNQAENATAPKTELEEKLFARIKTDLEPWRNGITKEMVEHTYCTVSFVFSA